MKILTNERKLTPSWQLVRPSMYLVGQLFWPVVYLSFIPALITSVGIYILGDDPTKLPSDQLRVGASVLGVGLAYSIVAYPAFLYLVTQAIKGKEPTTMECLRKGLPHLGPVIGLNIMSVFLVIVGMILLLVPGLIALRALYMAPYYLIDQKLTPTEAMKKSYASTQPVTVYIWGVIGVTMFFVCLGVLFDDIPVAGPVFALLMTYFYIFAPGLRYGEVSKTGKPIAKLIPEKDD